MHIKIIQMKQILNFHLGILEAPPTPKYNVIAK